MGPGFPLGAMEMFQEERRVMVIHCEHAKCCGIMHYFK